ncbi:hypothetical protein Godav_023247 [Gossypium davidsonii]|uniref:Uncharacterized protein n=1 Tax=Gossypium davidsonii TaxID=34287 RepID=A0A7J8SR46_GOSDV|nr:hypothetical protein [Gossypium davidsonii]
MKSNSFLNKKRKFYLNLLRNPIFKSREWKGLNIKDNPILKPISNGDECRDLIRDDDRLPSLNQILLEMESNSLLNRKRKGHLNTLKNLFLNFGEWKALKIQDNPMLNTSLIGMNEEI